MYLKHSFDRLAAIAAVSITIGGCGSEARRDFANYPARLGREAIVSCTRNVAITPQTSDLEHSIDLGAIYSHLAQSSFVYTKSEDPYSHRVTQSDSQSAPFLRIKVNEGRLCYEDVSHGGLTASARRSLLAAVIEDRPFIEAASEEKTLSEVDFRIISKNDLFPALPLYDEPEQDFEGIIGGKKIPVIEYPLDPRQPVPASDLRTMLRHEALHALTGGIDLSSYNVVKNHPREQEFAKACLAVRKIADEQASEQAGSVAAMLDQIATKEATPAQAGVLKKVANSLRAGTFTNLEPVTGEYTRSQADNFGIGNVPECTTDAPWYIALREMEKAKISTSSLLSNQNVLALVEDHLLQSWDELMRQRTIYSTIREATYLGDERSLGEGHPYDNWDETIVSTLDVALTYPDAFVANVNRLPKDEHLAIKGLLKACVQTFSQAQPELSGINRHLRNVLGRI